MSLAENIDTANRFASTWGSSPDWVMEEGVKSVYLETNRLDHSYPFFIDEKGTFVSNPENSSEKFYFRDIMDKYSYLGKKELRVFEKLEELAFHNEGNPKSVKAVWFTPLYPGRYPCSKVIIHEIFNDFGSKNKTIFNLVKVFDLSSNSCVEIAREIFPDLVKTNDPEELRSLLIAPATDQQIKELVEVIDELNSAVERPNLLTEHELSERAKRIVEMIRANKNPSVVALEMNELKLLGGYSISCPPTFSELLGGMDKYGSLKFKCPHQDCGRVNTRKPNELRETCEFCHKVIPRC